MDQEQLKRALRQALIECFSESELRTMCFDLGVDYDGLPGESKSDKARELVAHFQRRGHLMSLTQIVESLRPDAPSSNLLRRFLRRATQATQEIPYTDVLAALGKTGPLGVDYRTLVELSQQMKRLTHVAYVAASAGLLSLLIAILALVVK